MIESSLSSSSLPATTKTISKIRELLSRVEVLERKRFSKANRDLNSSNNEDINHDALVVIPDESMRRARYAVETQATLHYSAVWKYVPENYYHTSLEERAQCLQAPSIHYLCKSLLLENRKVITTTPSDDTDPTNPRFVLVVIQYASVLDTKKLSTAIRKLRTDVTQRLDVSQFDFRIATEIDNDTITGYAHNSVTPFGMRCQQQQRQRQKTKGDDNQGMNARVPIILSSALLPLHFLWMGGGHVHLKLGMSVSDFCYAFRENNLIIADISRPRTSTGSDNTDDDSID